ncbi:Transcription factor E4F1 [Mizuhopecten yessoensis]|uniref:Transcription factor E4F1 n=1 Tax=Mizuhopecten yessoensis TaxID=6573 RepID=A0A210Q3H1_MIZYE|nr:Transcription factor E4F1 [Mizuhopecten yessoensis]
MPELDTSSLNMDSYMGMLDLSGAQSKNTNYLNESEFRSDQSKLGEASVVATCHLCQKEFKSLWGYKCHKKIHAISLGQPDDCFKCFECGKFCQSVSHLRRHMRCHSEEKPFKCGKCGKAYKHNNGLKVHQCRMSIEPSDPVGQKYRMVEDRKLQYNFSNVKH